MRGEVAARMLFTRLKELGMKYPYPLQDACEKLRIEVRFVPLGACDGCYLCNKHSGRIIILINRGTIHQRVSARRQRFSLAHELGHVVLRHPPLAFLGDSMVRYPIHEIEANAFAAELLMPKSVLVARGPMPPEQIKSFCHVSLEAATIRARQLGWA